MTWVELAGPVQYSGFHTDYLAAGLFLLRLVVGGLVGAHGVQKVSFLLGGEGLDGGTKEFRSDGFRGGRLTAVVAGASQIGGGVLLLLGLLTPLSVAAVVGVMFVAASVKLPHGLWVQHDGYEYPSVLIVCAIVIGLTGPGDWSLDALLRINWPEFSGLVAAAVGVFGAVGTKRLLALPDRDE